MYRDRPPYPDHRRCKLLMWGMMARSYNKNNVISFHCGVRNSINPAVTIMEGHMAARKLYQFYRYWISTGKVIYGNFEGDYGFKLR
jgi:hypothetical protein